MYLIASHLSSTHLIDFIVSNAFPLKGYQPKKPKTSTILYNSHKMEKSQNIKLNLTEDQYNNGTKNNNKKQKTKKNNLKGS